MILVLSLLAVSAWGIVSAVRARRGVMPSQLGWMSDQWLAEYRASHAS